LPAGTFVTNPNLSQSVNYRNDALRPYYGWGSLNAIETLAYSRYNALMFRLSRRYANSLSMNFNYTYSKAMDLVDNDSDQIINPFNMRQNYAPAGYDQTHVVTADFVYDLPRVHGMLDNGFGRAVLNGWQVNGLIRSQSGTPFTVTGNGDTKGVDAGSQFVDLIGDPYAGQNSGRWINPAAFARPQDGQYGNLHRNALRLPHISNVDASLIKNFAIRENMRVTFRAETFNLFNHAQIWGINTGFTGDNPGSLISATNQNLGQPNSFRDARILQLALRFAF
jgi:hypothetical protein